MSAMDGTLCGLGAWRPNFLQGMATTRIFITIFGLLGTVQAMAFVYFIATITTLEKRFHMPSQTMGILMSGNEISQIALVLLLSYLGGKGNRPVWIAWGVSISALSCFILAAPHFIYGPGQTALALTKEFLDIEAYNASQQTGTGNPFTCNTDRKPADCSGSDYSLVPMVLVFISQFVLGIGTSLYFSVGQTYVDDNTKKKNTPKLLGITMALRTLGPSLGFALGAICLSMYIEPSLTPVIDKRDPRWLGAWWLGWVILGTAMLLFAFLLAMFPKNLPSKVPKGMTNNMVENPIYYHPVPKLDLELKPVKDEKRKKTPLPDGFLPTLKRVVKQPIVMANNSTAIFYILGASGYMTFYTKYTETQFDSSAAISNIVAAASTILSLVLGFLISGFIISKFKPSTPALLIYNIFIGAAYVVGQLSIMLLGCADGNMIGEYTEDGQFNPVRECNLGCMCDSIKYSPICHSDTQQTFFSACHAGCSSMNTTELGQRIFSNCTCIAGALTGGACPRNCGYNLYYFIAIVCSMQLIGSTGRITNVLINYRAVAPKDKALAQGLALFLISLFAFIPGPIIFGKIIDNACVIWDNTCGSKGNCWLYDKDDFKLYFNVTAASFTSCALIMDIVLYFKAKHIKLYEEPPDETVRTS